MSYNPGSQRSCRHDQDIDSTSLGGLLQGEFHSGLYLLDLHHVIRSLFYESDQFVSSGLLYFLASIADDERQKEMIIQCGFDSAYRVESLMLHHIRSQTDDGGLDDSQGRRDGRIRAGYPGSAYFLSGRGSAH